MNWKVCYKKDMEAGEEIKTVSDIESKGLTALKVEFPALIPDNTNCFYYASFTAYEYDYISIEGIDSIAEIFINGKKVATTDTNYACLNIKDGIVPGDNEILIFVHPKFGKASAIRRMSVKRLRKCSLENVKFSVLSVDESADIASVGVTADIKIRDDSNHDFNNLSYKIILKDEKKAYSTEGLLGYNHVDAKIEIQRPRLWWPKNHGKSVLYDAALIIMDQNRELCEYDAKIPIAMIENNIGTQIVNGKSVCLSGPIVPSFGNVSELIEKLDSLGANLCVLPKSYEQLDDETLEAFYDHGIFVSFKNTVPDANWSVSDVKKAIENYRIKKMYQPAWAIPEKKSDFAVIHDVNQPLFLAIEGSTGNLYCVSDLTYVENITYVVKDSLGGGKIAATGIIDVEPGTTNVVGNIAIVPNHDYSISWTTNSGKMHSNTFIN